MPAILTTHSLRVGYGAQALVPPIDLTIEPGELWLVIGRNGSGKTTLFKTLLGLHAPLAGRIETAPGFRPAYVPQRNAIDSIVPFRARDIVAMGCEHGFSFLRRPQLKQTVDASLEQAGARDLADARFADLSEGQKQKVLLARLIAAKADIAFLDEPTAAMDPVAENETLQSLVRIRDERNMALVMVTHFLGSARRFADKVLFMDSELNAIEAGKPEEVLQSESFKLRYGDSGEF